MRIASLCFFVLYLFMPASLRAADAPFAPLKELGPVETYGRQIQRSMALLATSTPQKRNTVRILFYGQSITEQAWTRLVVADLRKRFPHADLITENRAIGGFSSQILVKTAEADLYPFYPDLVIFHVYGSHIEYENIIRSIRERTTADILMQTDHMAKHDKIDEETDGAKLSPKEWTPWINAAFLPATAKKYGAELVNQRALWKQYLREQKLEPGALLRDDVHLNDHGCFVMAQIVSAYLRHDPKMATAISADAVKTYEVGKDVMWREGKLVLDFDGNRVDVIFKEGKAPPAMVRIDGLKPSEHAGCYAVTRTTSFPGSNWPCLLKVGRQKMPVLEDWTLTFTQVSPDMKTFAFNLKGSETGPDGEGKAGEKFISKSGRVVIDPADWNFDYAQKVFKGRIEQGFAMKWKVLPLWADVVVSPGVQDPAIETVVTVAQGLTNGRHALEITGSAETPIAAIRVYRPPLVSQHR